MQERRVDPNTVLRDHPPDNPEVREEVQAIASKRHCLGYRRISMPLERIGTIRSHNQLYRLYTEKKLGVRRRRGRKRARGGEANANARGFAAWRMLGTEFLRSTHLVPPVKSTCSL
ncbi:Integrase catalytic subunit [Sulfitobacter guttiformis KCTC 32187]|nr:Integrase catalytic subunit [Sulfitobacter guttiformis KCTC 32187]